MHYGCASYPKIKTLASKCLADAVCYVMIQFAHIAVCFNLVQRSKTVSNDESVNIYCKYYCDIAIHAKLSSEGIKWKYCCLLMLFVMLVRHKLAPSMFCNSLWWWHSLLPVFFPSFFLSNVFFCYEHYYTNNYDWFLFLWKHISSNKLFISCN